MIYRLGVWKIIGIYKYIKRISFQIKNGRIRNKEKGVCKMDNPKCIGNGTNLVSGKGVNSSPVVQQDINTVFAINAGITQYMVADNAFYRYVHQHFADKSSCKLPYLADSKVLRADNKYLKCIADSHIKISPYGFFEGAASAARSLYVGTMRQINDRVNFQFLIQSYFLYTALCLGISDNGRINLLTSNPNVIGAIPATKKEKEAAIKITHPITDDYNNNIVQCVELVQKPCGYVLRPAIINAAKQDYIILPLAWVNYLIDYIHNQLKLKVCKVSYYDPEGNVRSIIASNKPQPQSVKQCASCEYIKSNSCNCGWIRCVEVSTGDIIAIPVSHFIKIYVLK